MITFSVLVPNCLLFQLILSTSGNKVQEIQRQFMQQSRIPGIVGAIDCTYIPIQSPGGDTAESSLCLLSIIPFLLSYCQYTLFIQPISINKFILRIVYKRVLSVPNNLFPSYQLFHNIYPIYVINIIVHVYLMSN
jgi:hypothetical protein